MDESQASDLVFVVDREAAIAASDSKIIITMASKFSSFALTFEVDKHSSLKDVKAAFGNCADWHSGGLTYVYKNRLIQDSDTPAKLRMRNNDTIHVLAETRFTGNCSVHRRAEFNGEGFELKSVMNPGESLIVNFHAQDGYEQVYRIKPTTDLYAVCQLFGVQKREKGLRFLLDGDRIQRGDTPASLDMEDGDVIGG